MKRLYKSKENRMLFGVCGGIGEYFSVDPVIVRIVAVLLFFAGGSGILAYLIGAIVIPERPAVTGEVEAKKEEDDIPAEKNEKPAARDGANNGSLLAGLILVFIGLFFLMKNIPFFSEYYWWIKSHVRHFFWPGILMGLGLLIIFRNTRK